MDDDVPWGVGALDYFRPVVYSKLVGSAGAQPIVSCVAQWRWGQMHSRGGYGAGNPAAIS